MVLDPIGRIKQDTEVSHKNGNWEVFGKKLFLYGTLTLVYIQPNEVLYCSVDINKKLVYTMRRLDV